MNRQHDANTGTGKEGIQRLEEKGAIERDGTSSPMSRQPIELTSTKAGESAVNGTVTLGPIGQLATALVKAQATARPAAKTGVNPHYGSKYADLASVWAACRESLTRNGLSVVQMPNYDPNSGCVLVTTILIHTSGEYIFSTARAPITKPDPQAVGSAITYLRRYSLAAFVGVAPDDDDGEAASRSLQSHPEESVHETTTYTSVAPVPVWPFGKSKGKPLGELSDEELDQCRQWCVNRDTKKYARLIQQIDAELAMRDTGDIDLAS